MVFILLIKYLKRILQLNYQLKLTIMQGNQILVKLISVGDAQVGKSCIIKRYCQGRFVQKYITTIGVDYGVKKITVRGKKIAVNFFDLSGDEDYLNIRNPFFIDAQAVLLVFDLENRQSFTNITKWQSTMKQNGLDLKNCIVMLVGNKSDSKLKQVQSSQAQSYAKKKGYEYMQTSASSGENINQLFENAFNKLIDNIDDNKKSLK